MGATSGIGMEIAKLCIAAGWRVGIAGRRAEPLEKLRMSAPSQVVAGCIDITRESSATELIRLVEKLGGMDIYCHVSGIGAQNPTLDPAVELRTMETNVMGFTRMITAAYNYFARQGSGHIAVITSIAGYCDCLFGVETNAEYLPRCPFPIIAYAEIENCFHRYSSWFRGNRFTQ